jgi:hypothetical protein
VDRSLNKHIDAAIEGRIRNIDYDRTITVAEPIDCSVDIDRAVGAANLPNCAAESPVRLPNAVIAIVGSNLVSREQNMRHRAARGGNLLAGIGRGITEHNHSRVDGLCFCAMVRHRIACSRTSRFDMADI